MKKSTKNTDILFAQNIQLIDDGFDGMDWGSDLDAVIDMDEMSDFYLETTRGSHRKERVHNLLSF
jgi:hypothetical protein